MFFNKINLQKKITLLLAVLSFISVSAQLVIKTPIRGTISLRPHAELLAAEQVTYGIEQILDQKENLLFVPLASTDENYGFSDAHFWLRFTVINATDSPQDYYLETARPITDKVTFYQFGINGRKETQYSGDRIPFDQKNVEHRKSVFSIRLLPGETIRAFLHMKSDGEVVMLPLRLYSQKKFMESSYREQLFYGFFYGILMLAFVIYLFFFFALKDYVFVYYSCYVLCIALLQFSLDGLSHQYLTPEGGWLSDRTVLASALFSVIFLDKYAQGFLGLRQNLRFMNTLFTGLSVVVAASLVGLFLFPGFLAICYPIANILGLVALVLIIASVVLLKLKKHQVDIFFITGISFLVLGFVVFILNNLNLVPNSFFTENGAKFGIGLEVICLSISMSNRIRELRMENDANQRLALQRAQDMNEMKSSFLSNISHELRTPLNLIMGVATTLREPGEERKREEHSDLILKSSETLLGYIEDILDFTIIEKEGQKLEEVPFDLAQVIQKVVKANRTKAEIKRLEFDFIVSGKLPQIVIGDPTKLKQVLNNLLDNAIKFTSFGSIEVRMEPFRIKGKRVKLKFTISDTGIGISKDKMSTMYESFAKRSYLDKREFSGLGLGLYIVKTYVDLHGGTIDIRNRDQHHGTVCSVVLEFPLGKDAVEAEGLGKAKVLANPNHQFEGCEVLLVEDNKMNQMVIGMLVKKWKNVSLTVAGNGEEALQKIRERSFDIILLDLMMPVMDGFETMSIIRSGQAGPHIMDIPIIVITADITESTKREVLRLGANGYMTKPVKGDLLFDMIKENVDRTRSKEL